MTISKVMASHPVQCFYDTSDSEHAQSCIPARSRCVWAGLSAAFMPLEIASFEGILVRGTLRVATGRLAIATKVLCAGLRRSPGAIRTPCLALLNSYARRHNLHWPAHAHRRIINAVGFPVHRRDGADLPHAARSVDPCASSMPVRKSAAVDRGTT